MGEPGLTACVSKAFLVSRDPCSGVAGLYFILFWLQNVGPEMDWSKAFFTVW
jgi:hypothetical protein